MSESLKELSDRATPGPWAAESEKSEGSYGAGEDTSEGYETAVIVTEAETRYIKAGVLFESHNSTVGSIREEHDEEWFRAWDEVSEANAKFIAALVNAYRSGQLHDATALAEAEARGRRQLREDLSAKAEEQVVYWRKRQAAEKALEEGLSEDGETYTPIGDQPAWQSGYCNGRMSEADWWRQTLFYLSPDCKPPAPRETATAIAALAAFVSAFEGVATPLSERQERAYEEAARYLDDVGARPPCPCPACRDARARATAPAETQKPETGDPS